MPSWIVVVVIVIGVLVAGLVRERWRVRGMETWALHHGFVLHSPFVPAGRPPMQALAACLEGRDARLWGVGLT
ncbi:MAG TPA: hypothetical protein VJU18_19870 [Vicinamibacteria bacterium]|nr:hypothetical protein [Vicinamibacteria bacterium]